MAEHGLLRGPEPPSPRPPPVWEPGHSSAEVAGGRSGFLERPLSHHLCACAAGPTHSSAAPNRDTCMQIPQRAGRGSRLRRPDLSRVQGRVGWPQGSPRDPGVTSPHCGDEQDHGEGPRTMAQRRGVNSKPLSQPRSLLGDTTADDGHKGRREGSGGHSSTAHAVVAERRPCVSGDTESTCCVGPERRTGFWGVCGVRPQWGRGTSSPRSHQEPGTGVGGHTVQAGARQTHGPAARTGGQRGGRRVHAPALQTPGAPPGTRFHIQTPGPGQAPG